MDRNSIIDQQRDLNDVYDLHEDERISLTAHHEKEERASLAAERFDRADD